MSKLVQDKIQSGEARIVDAPKYGVKRDRSFGLPNALYGATVACYLGFVGVMAIGFGNPVLIIPLVLFALFIFAGFGVPAIWTRLKGNDSEPMTMGRFETEGIMTNTGRLAPRDAAVQVLLLPALVMVWAIVAVMIAAIVR